MRWSLVSFVLGLLALSTAFTDAAPAPPPDAASKEMAKGIRKAAGDHFSFVRARVAWNEHGHRHWLMTLRAREEGRYVLRVGVDFDWPKEVKERLGQLLDEGANWTYYLAIGKAGERRAVQPGGYAGAWPLACVGDEVVVPVRINAHEKGHRFRLEKEKGPLEDGSFAILSETGKRGWVRKDRVPAFALRNGAKEHLELIATGASSHGDRPGLSTHHSLGAVFEAVKAGKLDLLLKLDAPPKKGKVPGARDADEGAWSIEVAPRGQPITVQVPRYDTHDYRGKFNVRSSQEFSTALVPLRVGDRLMVHGGGYVTPGLDLPKKHPAVEAIRRPFAAPRGEWRDTPAR